MALCPASYVNLAEVGIGASIPWTCNLPLGHPSPRHQACGPEGNVRQEWTDDTPGACAHWEDRNQS